MYPAATAAASREGIAASYQGTYIPFINIVLHVNLLNITVKSLYSEHHWSKKLLSSLLIFRSIEIFKVQHSICQYINPEFVYLS